MTQSYELGGQSVAGIKDESGKPYSLFGANRSRYKYFKNGSFFVQKYIIFEDLDSNNDNSRNRSTVGIVSPDISSSNLDIMGVNLALSANAAVSQVKIGTILKNVKIGARLCYGLAVDPQDDSSDFKSREIAEKIFNNYAADEQSVGELVPNQGEAHTAASVGKYLVCHDGDNCLVGTVFETFDQILTKPLDTAVGLAATDKGLALAAVSPAAALAVSLAIGIERGAITDDVQPERDFYMKTGTYSIVIPFMSREQEILIDGEPVKDVKWEKLSSSIKNNSFDSAFENLRSDIINSEEYKVLMNLCFSAENILLFNTLAGVQFYGSSDLYRSFIQTKNMLKSNMMVTKNARKYDYIPPATTNQDYTVPEVTGE